MRLKRDSLFVGKREREREEGKGRDQHGLIPKCIKKWLSWMSLAWLWFPVELSKNKRNTELVVVVVDNVRPVKILSRKTHWEIQRGPIRWEVAKPRSIPVPNWRFEKPATKTQRNILFCNPHRSFIFLNKKKKNFFFSDTFQTKWTKEKWDVNQPPRTNKKNILWHSQRDATTFDNTLSDRKNRTIWLLPDECWEWLYWVSSRNQWRPWDS